jgi:hypothetical protein
MSALPWLCYGKGYTRIHYEAGTPKERIMGYDLVCLTLKHYICSLSKNDGRKEHSKNSYPPPLSNGVGERRLSKAKISAALGCE